MMRRPIAIALVAGGLMAATIWPAMTDALARYDRLRVAAAADAARIAQADAMPEAWFRLAAGSEDTARRRVAARVRALATANGVLVERLAARPALGPRLARVAVELSGSEKAVLTVADAIEREGQGARWREWRLTGLPGDAARMTGEVAVAWQ